MSQGRSIVNTVGNAVAAVVVAKWEGEFDAVAWKAYRENLDAGRPRSSSRSRGRKNNGHRTAANRGLPTEEKTKMENLSANQVNDPRPLIALLMGDCTGIGPELVANVLDGKRLNDAARLVVVAMRAYWNSGCATAGVELHWVKAPNTAAIDWGHPARCRLIDLGGTSILPASSAEKSRRSPAKLTGDTLACAIEMARRGEVDAITFAPLNKRAMFDGGWRFPDEHKMFAHLLGHQGYFSEMNVLDGQWMSRVTGHIALREALDQITPQRIREAITLADTMMRRAGIERPRIAVNGPQSTRRRQRPVRSRGDRSDSPGGPGNGGPRNQLQRPLSARHHLHQGVRGRVRQRGFHVPRPGPDRNQAARLFTAA